MSGTTLHSERRRELALLAAVLAIAAGLRFWRLSAQSLWYDEGYSLYYAGGSTFAEAIHRLSGTMASERFQPGYFLVLRAWILVFGNGEVALRSLSALLGVAVVFLCYLTGRRLFGARHGLVAAAACALSSFAVYYSQEVRPYVLLTALAFLMLYAFVPIAFPGPGGWTRRQFLFFFTVAAVACCASVLIWLFLAALCAAHFLCAESRRAWASLWGKTSLAAMPAVFMQAAMAPKGGSGGSISTATHSLLRNAIFVPYGILTGQTYGPPLESLRGSDALAVVLDSWPALTVAAAGAILLCIAIAGSLFRSRAEHSRRRPGLFCAYTLGFAYSAAAVFALVTRLNWQPRHTFFLLVPAVLLFPLALETVRGTGRRMAGFAAAGVAGVLLLGAVNLCSLWNYFEDPRYQRDDYRGAASRLTTGPAAPSVLLWGDLDLLRYYGAHHTLDGRGLPKERLAQEIQRLTHGSNIVVLAVNREFYWSEGGDVAAAMKPRYDLLSRERLRYFTIYRFVLRSAPGQSLPSAHS